MLRILMVFLATFLMGVLWDAYARGNADDPPRPAPTLAPGAH